VAFEGGDEFTSHLWSSADGAIVIIEKKTCLRYFQLAGVKFVVSLLCTALCIKQAFVQQNKPYVASLLHLANMRP